MRIKERVMLLMLLLGGLPAVWADNVPIVIDQLRINNDISDMQVLTGSLDAAFQRSDVSDHLTASHFERGNWYRLHLEQDWQSSEPPVLALFASSSHKVRMYLPPDNREQRHAIYDSNLDPRFSHRALAFILPPHIKHSDNIYVYIEAGRASSMPVQVTDLTHYQAEDLLHVRLSVLFAAIVLATLLITFCYWLILRDSLLLYFIGYFGGTLLYMTYTSGEFFSLPFAASLEPLGMRPAWFGATISAALSLRFLEQFADLERYTPRLNRIIRVLFWPFIALAPFMLIPTLYQERGLLDISNFLLLLAAVATMFAAVHAALRGGRQAGFYLLAWVPLFLVTMFRVVQVELHWVQPLWLEYGFPFAVAFAAVMMPLGLADRTLAARRERDLANRLAEHDPLTAVLNRRAITARLRVAFTEARRASKALALLFLDIDFFKRINDSYGHGAGDQCLKAVVEQIIDELRQGDYLGRYGGEEFLVVLPGAGGTNASVIAERIRRRVESMKVRVAGSEICVRISIGVAALYHDVSSPEELVERADTALYQAKTDGRNRVYVFGAFPPLISVVGNESSPALSHISLQ